MKKILPLLSIFLFVVSFGFAQSQAVNPLPQMDAAVKMLAADIGKRLSVERDPKITVGQFSFEGYLSPFGSYWANQLGEELSVIPNKNFIVLANGIAGADWIISGEVVRIAATIRVYTRLVRSSDRSVAAGFHTDFEQNRFIFELLSGGDDSSGIMRDANEPDSRDYPVSIEVGVDENFPVMDRSLHARDDEDFFLIVPDRDGRLVVETSGDMDTVMELYDADSGAQLADDDDGGSGGNARIRYTIQAGKRYLAKVRGYDGQTGRYGFRAYISNQPAILPDEYEDDNDSSSAKFITPGTPQRHSFHNGDDEDWVKFQVTTPGRYTIRARGVTSTRLDTRIELLDANVEYIDDDDDGGDSRDSRLSLRLESGLYYIKVDCLDDDPEDSYTLSVRAE